MMNPKAGFTLIEILVVILVVAIIGGLGARFITQPVQSYMDQTRRARLIDAAEMALRRMQRDIRLALPNSLRVSADGQYLELLHTVDGGRYRAESGGAGTDILQFTAVDSSFDVLGSLRATPAVGSGIAIYNLTASGSSGNAYLPLADNMIFVAAGSTPTHLNLDLSTNPTFVYARSSPFQRFFVVDGPVSYACESGQLNRYSGYSRRAAQPVTSGTFGVSPALVATSVAACNFSYVPGVSQRAGLVTLQLSLSESGESLTLLHQVHVVNAP